MSTQELGQRAVIYARQSLDRGGEGAAVDRQTADCRALAERRGWTVTEVLVDNDVSASTGRARPAYQQLLERMRTGSADVVVVWAVDRLTRRLVDLEEVIGLCETTGVRLATVTGDLDLATDTGRMLARILASVARGEVERKGERQRAANAQRAAAGQMGWTRRPFGYDRSDGAVVLVEAEAQGLRDAATMVLDGSTLAAACRMLDGRGLRTTIGKTWNVTSLRRALTSTRYSGRVTYLGADVATGAWPVILDADTQERLGEVLQDVTRRVQQGTEAKYLLSGLALCGRCGGTMFATPMGVKDSRWMAYRCPSCFISRRLDQVDAVVEGVILARLARPDAAQLLAAGDDVQALRLQAQEQRSRRDTLAGLIADGLLSATAGRARAAEVTARLRELEDRIARALGESPIVQLVAADDVTAAWEGMPLRARKDVVELLATVTILPAGRGQRFSPDHVQIDWRDTIE